MLLGVGAAPWLRDVSRPLSRGPTTASALCSRDPGRSCREGASGASRASRARPGGSPGSGGSPSPTGSLVDWGATPKEGPALPAPVLSEVRGPGLGLFQALVAANGPVHRSPTQCSAGVSPGATSGVGTEELVLRRLWTPWESGRAGWGRQDSFSDHRRVSLGRATRPGAAAHHTVHRGRPWEAPPWHARLTHRLAQAPAVLCEQHPLSPYQASGHGFFPLPTPYCLVWGSSLPPPERQRRHGVSSGGRRSPEGVGSLALVRGCSPPAG